MSGSYEMMYILRPDLSEERVSQEIQKYKDLFAQHGAKNIQVQNLGKRRLAYLIEKYQDGIYIQVNFQGDGQQVAPVERAMRLSEEVIRYLTLKLKTDYPLSAKAEAEAEVETNEVVVETQSEATETTPVETETIAS